MTTRISNTQYLTVLDPLPLENIGWTLRVLSERDYATQIALPSRFIGLGFTQEQNAEGGGSVTVDPDDPVWVDLPATEATPIFQQEALWQFVEDGIVRFEMLHEDTETDEIPEGGGARSLTLTGRGTGCVLDWAKVLPAGGYVTQVKSTTREFAGHPMAIWWNLFTEAQAAGFLTWVKPLFTADTDSTGRPWGPAQAVTVNLGDSLLDLLKRWCEANDLVWRMLPGFRLWVGKTEGTRLEGSVVFTEWKSQKSAGLKVSRREIATDVWVADSENGLAYAVDSGAQAKWRKRMLWVTAGDSSDATGRSAVANATLALSKTEKVSRTVAVPNLPEPRRLFVNYGVGDWVGFEVKTGDGTANEPRKVVAVAVEVSENGTVGVELTTQSRFESRAEKVKRLLDRTGSSAASGTSSPIPVSKAVSAVALDDLSDVLTTGKQVGDLLQWDGTRWVDATPNLDRLADVDVVTTAPTDKQALIYDAAKGLWVPGTVSGGGGSGGGGSVSVNLARLVPVTGKINGVTASASTISTMTDGVRGTSYVAVGSGVVDVVLDLGSAVKLTLLRVYMYPDTRTYRQVGIDVSVDGVTWAVALPKADKSFNGGVYVEGPAPSLTTAYRYVRCHSEGSTANNQNEYVEVEVYGPLAQP